MKIILDLCGGTGSWSKPYKDAGYDVRLVTLPDYNVIEYIPPANVYGILAAPPCEEFSIAKNHKLQRDFIKGMNTVNACIRIVFTCKPAFWVLENPIGYLSKYIGEPRFAFHPWQFGDPWTKYTFLWGKFNIPRIKYCRWQDVPKNDNLYIRPGRSKPSIAFLHKSATKECFPGIEYEPKTDADFRAITPQSFATAFYEANK